jgi:hypothetical protein
MDLTTLGIFLGFFLTGIVAGIPIGQASSIDDCFEGHRFRPTCHLGKKVPSSRGRVK